MEAFTLAVQGSLAGAPLVPTQPSKGLDSVWHQWACDWVSTLTEELPCILDSRMHIKETSTRTNSILPSESAECQTRSLQETGLFFTKLSFPPSKILSYKKDNTIRMLYSSFVFQEPLTCSEHSSTFKTRGLVGLTSFYHLWRQV